MESIAAQQTEVDSNQDPEYNTYEKDNSEENDDYAYEVEGLVTNNLIRKALGLNELDVGRPYNDTSDDPNKEKINLERAVQSVKRGTRDYFAEARKILGVVSVKAKPTADAAAQDKDDDGEDEGDDLDDNELSDIDREAIRLNAVIRHLIQSDEELPEVVSQQEYARLKPIIGQLRVVQRTVKDVCTVFSAINEMFELPESKHPTLVEALDMTPEVDPLSILKAGARIGHMLTSGQVLKLKTVVMEKVNEEATQEADVFDLKYAAELFNSLEGEVQGLLAAEAHQSFDRTFGKLKIKLNNKYGRKVAESIITGEETGYQVKLDLAQFDQLTDDILAKAADRYIDRLNPTPDEVLMQKLIKKVVEARAKQTSGEQISPEQADKEKELLQLLRKDAMVRNKMYLNPDQDKPDEKKLASKLTAYNIIFGDPEAIDTKNMRDDDDGATADIRSNDEARVTQEEGTKVRKGAYATKAKTNTLKKGGMAKIAEVEAEDEAEEEDDIYADLNYDAIRQKRKDIREEEINMAVARLRYLVNIAYKKAVSTGPNALNAYYHDLIMREADFAAKVAASHEEIEGEDLIDEIITESGLSARNAAYRPESIINSFNLKAAEAKSMITRIDHQDEAALRLLQSEVHDIRENDPARKVEAEESRLSRKTPTMTGTSMISTRKSIKQTSATS